MKYLLDTNICVYFLNQKKSVVEEIKQIPNEDLAISIITIAELEYGASNSEKIENNLRRIDFLKNKIKTLDIDFEIAREYGKIKSKLRKQGNLIDDFDILIGATAVVRNLTLITNNQQHFSRLKGVIMKNWVR
jgi:tRNA(fMet)-specific endonuclease VapC